jgi:hypothetical protein
VDRWAGADPHYDGEGQDGLTGHTPRRIHMWIGLLVAWVLVAGLLSILHLGVLIWVIMIGLIGFVIYRIPRETPRAPRSRGRRRLAGTTAGDGHDQFNAPPGWPDPPLGWIPPRDWEPKPAWPPAPPGWQRWLSPAHRGPGRRATHTRRRQS